MELDEHLFQSLTTKCQWWEIKPATDRSNKLSGYSIVVRRFDSFHNIEYMAYSNTVEDLLLNAIAWLVENPQDSHPQMSDKTKQGAKQKLKLKVKR